MTSLVVIIRSFVSPRVSVSVFSVVYTSSSSRSLCRVIVDVEGRTPKEHSTIRSYHVIKLFMKENLIVSVYFPTKNEWKKQKSGIYLSDMGFP